MKTLNEYITDITGQLQETDMKPRKIVAEQANDDLVLWNSDQDRWSRNAKHPIKVNELSNEDLYIWLEGDKAIFESKEVEIKIPAGPNGTTGIIIEGKTKMVLTSKLSRVDEGVMGSMQALNPLNRIMQLAGLSVPATVEPTEIQVSEEQTGQPLEEAGSPDMFNALFDKNLKGEFANNPPAARVATVGEIMVGLNSQIEQLGPDIPSDLSGKLKAVLGIGAALMQTARAMTKPQTQAAPTAE